MFIEISTMNKTKTIYEGNTNKASNKNNRAEENNSNEKDNMQEVADQIVQVDEGVLALCSCFRK